MSRDLRFAARRAAAALLTIALLVPAAAEAASLPWSGYRIKPAPTADGGFMGARKTDGRVTYRLDAGARRHTYGYRSVHRVSVDRRHARAAWILSKYGAVQIADQSAAVDVATYALVSDRPLSGARAKARLRATGHAASIRSLAKYMLTQSTKYAGPYTLTVTTKPAVVGGKVKVSARVTSYAGQPVANLPVHLRVQGIAKVRETNAKGRVTTTFPAIEVGLRKLKVVVRKVPEWRLLVRKPKRAGASRIAVAGRKTRLVAHDVVAVRATPTVAVPAAATPQEVGKPFAATFTIAGSEGTEPRTLTASLFGPYPQGWPVSCTGTPLRTLTSQVQGDGTYRSPSTVVPGAAVYFWKVQVGANQLNTATEACGGLVRVRTTPTIKLDAMPGSKLTFTVSGLPGGYDDYAELTLHGPYKEKANATCFQAKKVGEVTVHVTHSGTFTSPRIKTVEPGFYTWRVRLPAGYLVIGQRTACGGPGSFVKVT
jgi:hypothetical protein